MVKSLKGKNKLPLFTTMVANLVLFYLATKTDALVKLDLISLITGITDGIPATLGVALIGVLNAQLSPEAKARIVFLRWRNALPGCEAFTRYAGSDPRIDLSTLARTYWPLPIDPSEQNALWYKLFKSVEAEPSVTQAHAEFLFTRDYNCLSLMMLFVLGGAGLLQIPSAKTTFAYLAFLIVQFLLTGRAARVHGRRLVTTVLALNCARPQAAI